MAEPDPLSFAILFIRVLCVRCQLVTSHICTTMYCGPPPFIILFFGVPHLISFFFQEGRNSFLDSQKKNLLLLFA